MTIPESPFVVLHDLVLVEFLPKRETSIHMPDGSSPENLYSPYVIAIGPGRKSEHGEQMSPAKEIKVGDEVMLNPNTGTMFTHPVSGDRKFVMVRHLDITAIIRPDFKMEEKAKILLFGGAAQ